MHTAVALVDFPGLEFVRGAYVPSILESTVV